MSEKSLSAYPDSSTSEVLLYVEQISPWWRRGAIALGIATMCVGGYDLASRVEPAYFEMETIFAGLAPLGTLTLVEGKTQSVPAPLPATTTPIVPTRIRIPAIEVDAQVEAVGLKSDGETMATPKKFTNVGWYKPGTKPGEEGNAVFAGHLNSPILAKDGAFKNLGRIKVGDRIIISDKSGKMLSYSVTDTETYKTELAPREEIFSKKGPSHIVLITCEGEWDPKSKTFDKRLVVIARLLP